MDIYEPQGDTVMLRPLIVWAHGGSFLGGTKNDQDVTELCNRFTKMGYVCASVEYRVGFFPLDSVNAIKAVLRATQDMKAAVRWFRQDAAGANTYKIHPNYIFTGGSSAGAFMALHLAYLDKVSEFPLGATVLSQMGGMDGTSGNPGWPHNTLAVINLCGALGDSVYLEPGDVPFCSMHGNADQIVPFGSAIIYVLGLPILNVDGSSSLEPRGNNVGVYNVFYPFWNANHVPYAGATGAAALYMDTTEIFVKTFLRPFLGLPVGTSFAAGEDKTVLLFPNPADSRFTVYGLEFTSCISIDVLDLQGRIVKQVALSIEKSEIDISDLQPGVYFVKSKNWKNNFCKKLVVQ